MASGYNVKIESANSVTNEIRYALWTTDETQITSKVYSGVLNETTVKAPLTLLSEVYGSGCNPEHTSVVTGVCCPYNMIGYSADTKYGPISIPGVGLATSLGDDYVPFRFCWTFGNTITTIGSGSFSALSSPRFNNIVFPRTVTTIASDAFPGGSEISVIILPNNTSEGLSTLLSNSTAFFAGLGETTSVVLQDSKLATAFNNLITKTYTTVKVKPMSYASYLETIHKTIPDITKISPVK